MVFNDPQKITININEIIDYVNHGVGFFEGDGYINASIFCSMFDEKDLRGGVC